MTGKFALDQDPATLSEDTKHSVKDAAWHPSSVDASDLETKLFGVAQTAGAQTSVGATLLPVGLQNHPRYEILDFLGAGGMGMVFKARHRVSGHLAALKMIHPTWAEEPAMAARFRGEIRAVARLCHPNIVVAHAPERAGNADVLVMEYVEGLNLEEFLARQNVPEIPKACAYIRQASLGLQHTHEQGLVHRDIKPQNLMLTAEGQIKILDFGLARFTAESAAASQRRAPTCELVATKQFDAAHPADGSESEGVTPHWRGRRLEEMAAGYPLGTVDYLAPEEVEDPRLADIRADIYSLGCTLYRLLTGRVPFAGGRLVEKLKAHRQRMPTPVDALRPAVPPKLARLVARMMAKSPAERFQTPIAVAEALAAFVGE